MRSSRAYDGDLEVLPPDWPFDEHDVGNEPDGFGAALEICREIWEGCAAPARRARNGLHPLEDHLRSGWDRFVRPARRISNWYGVAIGAHRGFDPRHHPHVRRNVESDPKAVVEVIATAPIARGGDESGPTLWIEPQIVEQGEVERVHEASARLHIPWSYPDLPMSLRVVEWSADRCVLDLTLRSRRRIRYPLRYYNACHQVLTDLSSQIAGMGVQPAGSS